LDFGLEDLGQQIGPLGERGHDQPFCAEFGTAARLDPAGLRTP
jgi:hypothetical protein